MKYVVALCVLAASAHAIPPADPATKLRAELAADGEMGALKTERIPGPLDLQTVRVFRAGRPPGVGVRAVLVDSQGVSFGRHGERDLAALFRERKWIDAPPDSTVIERLLSVAEFEGLLDLVRPLEVRRDPGALTISLDRYLLPSRHTQRVVVRLPVTGQVRIDHTEPIVVEVAPITAAERALDAGDVMAILAAIGKLNVNEPKARALLVRATLVPNDAVYGDALQRLGKDPGVARALRDAWAKMPVARRRALIDIERELQGAAFAQELER